MFPLFLLADRGAQFICGLSDTVANIAQRTELSCKLSSEATEGRWYKNGKLVNQLFLEDVEYRGLLPSILACRNCISALLCFICLNVCVMDIESFYLKS